MRENNVVGDGSMWRETRICVRVWVICCDVEKKVVTSGYDHSAITASMKRSMCFGVVIGMNRTTQMTLGAKRSCSWILDHRVVPTVERFENHTRLLRKLFAVYYGVSDWSKQLTCRLCQRHWWDGVMCSNIRISPWTTDCVRIEIWERCHVLG